jgi:hypothetical protein
MVPRSPCFAISTDGRTSPGGVGFRFLGRWYDSDFRSRLTIVATIDDIYYGLALLRSKMAYGCMLTSVSIARAAAEGRLPGGPGLRTVSLGPDFSPMMELVTGTFARRGERTAFGASHPHCPRRLRRRPRS